MATRSLKVEFLPTDFVNGIGAEPADSKVHDISLPDSVVGVPEILENPHVDFPGTWQLVGDGVDGSHRYQRVDRVADTSDTVARLAQLASADPRIRESGDGLAEGGGEHLVARDDLDARAADAARRAPARAGRAGASPRPW